MFKIPPPLQGIPLKNNEISVMGIQIKAWNYSVYNTKWISGGGYFWLLPLCARKVELFDPSFIFNKAHTPPL